MGMRSLLLAVALAPLLPAQDILHYRFESGGGRRFLNHAAGSGLAPTEGRLVGLAPQDPWTDGRFGGGYHPPTDQGRFDYQIDTGWDGWVQGSFTIAFFLRQSRPFSGSTPLFGNGNNFRFEVLSSGPGLFLMNGRRQFQTQTDLVQAAATGWTHVAVTCLDGVNADYLYFYVNGQLDSRHVFDDTVQTSRGLDRDLHVGGSGIPSTSTAGVESSYDLDEFLIRHGHSTLSEVQALASAPLATDSRYGAGCNGIGNRGGFLDHALATERPILGNPAYKWLVQGFPASIYSVLVGSHRASFQGQPLPFDLAAIDSSFAGCLLDTAADVTTLTGTLDFAGNDTIPVPVPADPAFEGLSLFAQAALLHPPSTTFLLSNGLAVSIGL